MPLVINSLEGGDTHTHTHTHTHTCILTSWTKVILRNQAHTGLTMPIISTSKLVFITKWRHSAHSIIGKDYTESNKPCVESFVNPKIGSNRSCNNSNSYLQRRGKQFYKQYCFHWLIYKSILFVLLRLLYHQY